MPVMGIAIGVAFVAFQLIAAEEPQRVKLVDASGPEEHVTKLRLQSMEDLLQ